MGEPRMKRGWWQTTSPKADQASPSMFARFLLWKSSTPFYAARLALPPSSIHFQTPGRSAKSDGHHPLRHNWWQMMGFIEPTTAYWSKSISASSFFLTVVGQHTRGRRQSASGTKQLADGRRLSGDRGRWADCPAVFLYIHDAVKELNPSHSPTDTGVRWSQPNRMRGEEGKKERKKRRS